MKIRSKKGVWGLVTAALGIGAFAIVMATIALILVAYQGQTEVNSSAYNIAGYGITTLLVMAGFLSIIGIGVMGFYLIRMMVGGLGGFRGSNDVM